MKAFLLLKVTVGALMFSPLAFLSAVSAGVPGSKFWTVVAALSVLYSLVLQAMLAVIPRAMSGGLLRFIFPMRATGGAHSWSTSRALGMMQSGKTREAEEEFERLRAIAPNDGTLLREMVEFHLGLGNAEKCAELLVHLRQAPGRSAGDELYAMQRLIDLYLGPLQRPDRAVVEMRRLADRFPGTPDGKGALAELRRRKQQLEHAEPS